ncbi:hypothetical protein GQ457_04G013360 [Hibiscus cannabinus]
MNPPVASILTCEYKLKQKHDCKEFEWQISFIFRDCNFITDITLQENRYIAAQLVAFLGQTPQSFTTSVAFSRKTPLVNISGVFAPNAASFWRLFDKTPQLVNFSGVFAPNATSFVIRM